MIKVNFCFQYHLTPNWKFCVKIGLAVGMDQLFNNLKVKQLIHVLLRNVRTLFLFCRCGSKDLEFFDYPAIQYLSNIKEKYWFFFQSEAKQNHGNYFSSSFCWCKMSILEISNLPMDIRVPIFNLSTPA